MENKYIIEEEEVKELIRWFKGRELPQEYQLDDATRFPNFPWTVETLCDQALLYHKNPTFFNTVRLLRRLKESLCNNGESPGATGLPQ